MNPTKKGCLSGEDKPLPGTNDGQNEGVEYQKTPPVAGKGWTQRQHRHSSHGRTSAGSEHHSNGGIYRTSYHPQAPADLEPHMYLYIHKNYRSSALPSSFEPICGKHSRVASNLISWLFFGWLSTHPRQIGAQLTTFFCNVCGGEQQDTLLLWGTAAKYSSFWLDRTSGGVFRDKEKKRACYQCYPCQRSEAQAKYFRALLRFYIESYIHVCAPGSY